MRSFLFVIAIIPAVAFGAVAGRRSTAKVISVEEGRTVMVSYNVNVEVQSQPNCPKGVEVQAETVALFIPQLHKGALPSPGQQVVGTVSWRLVRGSQLARPKCQAIFSFEAELE